ncbi:hypothetical protein QTG54_016733 [Skeletonema marinoi]|uniref:Uncharacterized protein n=1 Tax=Skeletonema marinoi TaxID=267567 RepID=A0AAD8XSA1_9STRA|nr:hypothetical protein QTG54_016733 [Skeletonema marinoi]
MNNYSTKNTNTADAAINRDYITTFTVPTKGAASTDEAPKRVTDIRNLSEEELKALRKQDPFLYYSIQSARNAALRRNSADMTALRNQEKLARSRRASCPSRVESTMVERKSCISFERHTDLLLEDCMDEAELFGNGAGADIDTVALFDQLLLRNKRQQ